MPIGGKDAFLSKVTFRRESNWYSKTKQELKNMKTIKEIGQKAYDESLAYNGVKDDAELARQYAEFGATEQKAIDIELAWDFFKHDVRVNYIHTFGHEPGDGVMEKYKELFIERMEK